MRDNYNIQTNVFGVNSMVNGSKKIFVKIVTKQRVQGSIAGIILSIIASYLYDLIKPLL